MSPNGASSPAAADARLQALVQALARARHDQTRLRAADWLDAVTNEEQAYAVQQGVARTLGWVSPQRPVASAWKSGAATRDGPYGHAPLDPAGLRQQRFEALPPVDLLLGFEAEIALRLGRDVSPGQALALQPEQVLRRPGHWIDALCVSVELVGSRWQEGLDAPELLRLADHQSHAGLLLGPWQRFAPRDWSMIGLRIAQPGRAALRLTGAHALLDPAWLLPAWLRHLSRDGHSVPAGTLVSTGAWGGLQGLSPAGRDGAPIEVEFEGLAPLRWHF